MLAELGDRFANTCLSNRGPSKRLDTKPFDIAGAIRSAVSLPLVCFRRSKRGRSHASPMPVKIRHRRMSVWCPLYPQKRTLELSLEMSALCQKRTSTTGRIGAWPRETTTV